MRASRAKALSKSNFRSAVTNGTTLVQGVDGRSHYVRRFRDLISLHSADLGGPERLSQAQQSLVRRIAAITIECELLEARFADAGSSANALEQYQRLSNTLRRLLQTVGIQRKAHDVTPDLQSYLRNRSNQRVTLEHDG